MLDVSTIRVEGGVKVGSDLICTCPNQPPLPPSTFPSSSSSHSVIATAAILPPPPSFLCSDPPGHVQTVALTKVKTERNFTNNLTVGEIDTDCMFSNDYEDECLTVCLMCEKSLKYCNLGSHLYQSHKSKMRTYIEKFGEPEFSKKTYHECAICHETLLFMKTRNRIYALS